MKIGIDVSQVTYTGTGVSRYVRNLIESLIEYDKKNSYVLFFSSLRRSFPKDLEKMLPANFELRQYYFPPTILEFLWNQTHRVKVEHFIGDIDVFYSSDWTQPPSLTKKITTVHDLIVYKYPETSTKKIVETQKRKLALVKKECDLILCDSEATAHDLHKILHVSKEKLRVVYPSVHLTQTAETANTLSKHALKKPFMLTVGKLEPRKNIPSLIEAFTKAKLEDVELVVVGLKGWEKSLDSTPNVRFLGYVPDSELQQLYKNAEFFVFPSLYEGFGYPVVEAMSYGCPVAVSENSSLSEIANGAAYTFDPTSVKSIQEALTTMHSDEKLRKKLSQQGKENAKRFTKKAFAQSVLKVFEELQ
jgi:glycosyltransferase involved in cell wall biosynthesis